MFSSTSYACKLGEGALQALVTIGLLFISIVLSCVTPKSTPVIRVVQEREYSAELDPCCCIPGRSKQQIYEENPELLLATLPSEQVELPKPAIGGRGGGGGHPPAYALKHYYDDQTGGITLQSQYTAASKRWLQCEQNYAEALDRFKLECRDAAPSDNSRESDWRYMILLPRTNFRDPELLRQRVVLDTLKKNCSQARMVMDRIEEDLEEHIRPAKEKIEAALKELQQAEAELQFAPTEPVNTLTPRDDSPVKEFDVAATQEPEEVPYEPPRHIDSFNTPEIAKEEDDQAAFNNGETFAESFSIEENQFRSALMTVDESNIEDVGEFETTKSEGKSSWASWMGFDASEDTKYKKVT